MVNASFIAYISWIAINFSFTVYVSLIAINFSYLPKDPTRHVKKYQEMSISVFHVFLRNVIRAYSSFFLGSLLEVLLRVDGGITSVIPRFIFCMRVARLRIQ